MRSSEVQGTGEEAQWTGGGQVELPSLLRGWGLSVPHPLAPDSTRPENKGTLVCPSQACILAAKPTSTCHPSCVDTVVLTLGCLSLMLVDVVSAPVPAPGSPARCPRTLFPQHLPSDPAQHSSTS